MKGKEMLKRMKEEDIDRILAYLKKDVENCIYMYTDIYAYRLANPQMKVWFSERKEEVAVVLMKYHNSFSIYADCSKYNDLDFKETIQIIKDYDVSMINARKEIIDKVAFDFQDEYFHEYGFIIRVKTCKPVGIEQECSIATKEDVPEIASLLAQDEFYKDAYTSDELEQQLLDRMRTEMGRSCIIRRDGKIVAHSASFTEADGIAVRGGTICHKDYRGQKLGIAVENYITMHMNENGYRWYTFVTEESRKISFEAMGNPVVAYYGKLIKKG